MPTQLQPPTHTHTTTYVRTQRPTHPYAHKHAQAAVKLCRQFYGSCLVGILQILRGFFSRPSMPKRNHDVDFHRICCMFVAAQV